MGIRVSLPREGWSKFFHSMASWRGYKSPDAAVFFSSSPCTDRALETTITLLIYAESLCMALATTSLSKDTNSHNLLMLRHLSFLFSICMVLNYNQHTTERKNISPPPARLLQHLLHYAGFLVQHQ